MLSCSKRLLSFKKELKPEFVNYIENSSNCILYKLGTYNIPQNIFFPNVNTVTLINCTSNGVVNMLRPHIFPNVNTIHYLSANPGNHKLSEIFKSNVKWIFPDKDYIFYNYMVQSGLGKKDPELLKTYLKNKKIIDGKNGFDISFEFDLNIPNYGIVSGEWWRHQFYEYLVTKQNNIDQPIKQELEEEYLQKEIIAEHLYNLDKDNEIQ
jgi:hypothetical protein